MARRRRSPATNQLSISVTDLEWELIRERAKARRLTISRYLMHCGATVNLAPEAAQPPALVLREEEQRQLLRDTAGIAELLQDQGRPLAQVLEEMSATLGCLLTATALAMVREGRGDEMRRILRQVFGEDRAHEIGRQLGVCEPQQRTLL